MNRAIKFRAWDRETKKMYLIEDYSVGESIVRKKINPELIEVMQYTGLKDKNGKEMYEGDIVRRIIALTKDYYSGEIYYSDWCRFEVGRGQWPLVDSDYELTQDKHEKWEIIGNIYEHPELLTTNPKKYDL